MKSALISCVVCGTPLPATASPNRKTCSDACRKAWRTKYIRAWHDGVKADPAAHAEHLRRERETHRARMATKRLSAVKKVVDERTG